MPRRAAMVTQADVARVIRVMEAAGLSLHRVVVRPDGVAVETIPQPEPQSAADPGTDVANEERVVILMTLDMPRPRPPHLVRDETSHGRVVWYARKEQGKRICLTEPYGSEAFWRDYRLALDGTPVEAKGPATGSLSWLIGK